VGQDLRGDDAAGIRLVRRLQRKAPGTVDCPVSPGGEKASPSNRELSSPMSGRSAARLHFEAGLLPEASAGPLRRFGPDWVIFLDAAEMGEPPGTVRWIEPQEVEDGSASTHTFPMGGFAGYIAGELGCRVGVLGIQPKQIEFDAPISNEVLLSIERIAARITGAAGSPALDPA
jgi:hydrogenase 3 maturation protease